jgi:hypothetical protein
MSNEHLVSKRKAWAIIFLLFSAPIILTGAGTLVNLATQVSGVLATGNGGTGQNSSAVFPASGTLMTTTTGVAASQLPNPTASTLGGVESLAPCSAGQHINTISTSGVPACSADTGANLNQAAPTGTINGSNVTFTLSPTPAAAGNVNCFENGLQQQQGAGNDYTISGATITYLTAPPTGTKINCLWY